MGGLTDAEKNALSHFFSIIGGDQLLLQLAKNITKSAIPVSSNEEALGIILLHSSNIRILLNKRCITRELIFKYLHQNKVPVTDNFTKPSLIEKLIDFWEIRTVSVKETSSVNKEESVKNSKIDEYQFPIHFMAREFAQWFYNRLNSNSIVIADFWIDSKLEIQLVSNDSNTTKEALSNQCVLDTLLETKNKLGICFNPNISHDGIQGRVNIHGLVLVLCCGTIHTVDNCVGIFESVFGLMRDPYVENNWKMKTIKMILRNTVSETQPCLTQSESLRNFLELPAPSGNIG